MAVSYKIPRGTRANLIAMATGGTLIPYQAYWLTDDKALVVATSTTTWELVTALNWVKTTATGTGASQNITLSSANLSVDDVFVTVNGLVQTPTLDYTMSGSTLTITANVGDTILARYQALTPTGYSFINSGASALVTRMTTAPNDARKELIDTTYGMLNTAGVLTKLDAFYMFEAHDQQAARLNWITNAYNCTENNTPEWVEDWGYRFDGVSMYLDTGFNPSTASSPKFTQNSATLGVRMTESYSPYNNGAFGFYDGSKGATLAARNTNNAMSVRLNSVSATQSATDSVFNSQGIFTGRRTGATTSSADQPMRREKAALTLGTGQASTTVANGNFRVGAISASNFADGAIGCAFMGGFLTNTEVDAVVDAINYYRSGLTQAVTEMWIGG